jgi:hypothetical protein
VTSEPRLNLSNIIESGVINTKGLKLAFPRITKKRIKLIEKLIKDTKAPRKAAYEQMISDEEVDLSSNQIKSRLDHAKGDLGEEFAKLIIENHEVVRIIQYFADKRYSEPDDQIEEYHLKSEPQPIKNNQIKRYNYSNSDNLYLENLQSALFASMVNPNIVKWTHDYSDKDERLDYVENLENFRHIWYHGFYRFESNEPCDLYVIDKERWDFLRKYNVIGIPDRRFSKILSELTGQNFQESERYSLHTEDEVLYAFYIIQNSGFHHRLSFLDEDSLMKYKEMLNEIKNDILYDHFLSLIEETSLKSILRKYRIGVNAFALDLTFTVRYKGSKKTKLLSIEVKSSSILCEQHGKRGSFSLSKAQRNSLKLLLNSNLYLKEDIIDVRLIKLNFCECGLIDYFLISPQ